MWTSASKSFHHGRMCFLKRAIKHQIMWLVRPQKLTAGTGTQKWRFSSDDFPFQSFANFRFHVNFPGYKRHFMLLTFVCWWRATPLAGGICTHIGPQVYWRSLTDFWGRVLFQQKPFKCFSVTGLLNYQQHDIGVSGGTSVLLLEDDPACFWVVKVYFQRKKNNSF